MNLAKTLIISTLLCISAVSLATNNLDAKKLQDTNKYDWNSQNSKDLVTIYNDISNTKVIVSVSPNYSDNNNQPAKIDCGNGHVYHDVQPGSFATCQTDKKIKIRSTTDKRSYGTIEIK